jgi:hypothetical protein
MHSLLLSTERHLAVPAIIRSLCYQKQNILNERSILITNQCSNIHSTDNPTDVAIYTRGYRADLLLLRLHYSSDSLVFVSKNLFPRKWAVPGKLIVAQLGKKFIASYEARFMSTITRSCHWSLFWARWIHSTPSYPVFLRSAFNIILPFTPPLPKWSLPFR